MLEAGEFGGCLRVGGVGGEAGGVVEVVLALYYPMRSMSAYAPLQVYRNKL